MKRSIVLSAVVVMILAAFGPARADEVIPPPGRQSVSGTGIANSNYFQVEASTSGETVVGWVNFEVDPASGGGVLMSGRATLLCASGNRAVVAGAVEYGPSTGKWFVLHVEDNGRTTPPSDLLRLEILDAAPAACPAFNLDSPWQVTQGDIGVSDGTLPPPVLPPLANAGPDQSVHQGTTATLDGSGSSDPDGNYPLNYAWEIVSKPVGSGAVLSDPTAIAPSFAVDTAGDYTAQLIVTDSGGVASAPDQVRVSTYNTPPVAAAGNDQVIMLVETEVTLDGSQSYDEDGDTITYEWAITSKPMRSLAFLPDPTSATTTFVADVNGTYAISLRVRDLWVPSAVDTVTISFDNVKPVANAGGNQSITLGETIIFDGRGSLDANNDPLKYRWSLVSKPEGSQAPLQMYSDSKGMFSCYMGEICTSMSELVPDVAGTYVVSLVVNDRIADSDPSNATVTVMSVQGGPSDALRDLIDEINGLEPAVFKNANMGKALTNKINAVLADIEQGNYAAALDKLRNDILGKMDGCAVEGAPDKNDWLKTCSAQGLVYPQVMEAIGLLEGM